MALLLLVLILLLTRQIINLRLFVSLRHRQGTPQQRAWEGSPAVVTERRLYSEALTNRKTPNRFKLTVKSKEPLPPESIKGVLKAKINPSKIRVGINTLRTLRNGQVLIETSSREELEAIEIDK